MSDKYFVGSDLFSSSNNGRYKPVSRITLKVDDSKVITAGDDTGFELVADCPHATQDIADSLLLALKGIEYQTFSADGVNINPSAELGDGVTVRGIYSVLSMMRDDGSGYPSAEAPGKAEDEDEYPAGGPMTREFERQLAAARSLISKTSEEIRLEVFGEGGYTGASVHTLIGAAIGKIRLEVSGENGTTSFKLTDGTAEISSQSLDLKVKAVNITGTLTIGQLPEGVATTGDIPTATDITIITNNAIQTGTVRVNSLYGENIYLKYFSGYDYLGNPVYSNAGIISVSDASTAPYAFDLTSYGAMRLTTNSGDIYLGARGSVTLGGSSGASCIGNFIPGGGNDGVFSLGASWSRWSTVYAASSEIVTSDRNKKHSIDYDLTRYENLFGRLLPAVYKFNDGTSDRYHIGFISQDVEEGLAESDMTSLDFAGFIKSPKKIEGEYDYALRYEEFIALNTYMIQKLMARVDELERRQMA